MINLRFKGKASDVNGFRGVLLSVGKIGGMIVLGIGAAALIALALGFIVGELWNWLMPTIFGLPPITYWQAVGLLVLAHILLKAHHASHEEHGPHRGGKSGVDKKELARDVAKQVKELLASGDQESIKTDPEPPVAGA